jgi:hypothetical protein
MSFENTGSHGPHVRGITPSGKYTTYPIPHYSAIGSSGGSSGTNTVVPPIQPNARLNEIISHLENLKDRNIATNERIEMMEDKLLELRGMIEHLTDLLETLPS